MLSIVTMVNRKPSFYHAMKEFIAVKSIYGLNNVVKQAALIFDRIAVPNLFDISFSDLPSHIRSDLEWLLNKNIIFEVKEDIRKEDLGVFLMPGFMEAAHLDTGHLLKKWQLVLDIQKILNIKQEISAEAAENTRKKLQEIEGTSDYKNVEPLLNEYARNEFLYDESQVRTRSLELRYLKSMDTVPLFIKSVNTLGNSEANMTDVAQIILKELPIPNDSVSWEQILDYRADPDTRSKFLALRNWMSETVRAKLNPTEVEQKLEYLIYQYKQHLDFHKMKTSTTAFETVIVSTAEVLENLVKFNFGKSVKTLFALKHRRIGLLEAELTAPGNEIAYITKTRETFS